MTQLPPASVWVVGAASVKPVNGLMKEPTSEASVRTAATVTPPSDVGAPALSWIGSTTRPESTDVPGSLRASVRYLKRRGLVVVISDLIDDPEATLKAIRLIRSHRHDVRCQRPGAHDIDGPQNRGPLSPAEIHLAAFEASANRFHRLFQSAFFGELGQ